VHARQVRQFGTRRIAVEHLLEKSMDGGDRTEKSLAMNMTEVVTRLLDRVRRKSLANIGLELADDISDRGSHPCPPGNDKVL